MVNIKERLIKITSNMIITPNKNMSSEMLDAVNWHNGSIQSFMINAVAVAAVIAIIDKGIATEDEIFKYIDMSFDTNAANTIFTNKNALLEMMKEEAEMFESIRNAQKAEESTEEMKASTESFEDYINNQTHD